MDRVLRPKRFHCILLLLNFKSLVTIFVAFLFCQCILTLQSYKDAAFFLFFIFIGICLCLFFGLIFQKDLWNTCLNMITNDATYIIALVTMGVADILSLTQTTFHSNVSLENNDLNKIHHTQHFIMLSGLMSFNKLVNVVRVLKNRCI